MCKSQAEGGRRCPSSSHYVSTPAKRALDRAVKKISRSGRNVSAEVAKVGAANAAYAKAKAALTEVSKTTHTDSPKYKKAQAAWDEAGDAADAAATSAWREMEAFENTLRRVGWDDEAYTERGTQRDEWVMMKNPVTGKRERTKRVYDETAGGLFRAEFGRDTHPEIAAAETARSDARDKREALLEEYQNLTGGGSIRNAYSLGWLKPENAERVGVLVDEIKRAAAQEERAKAQVARTYSRVANKLAAQMKAGNPPDGAELSHHADSFANVTVTATIAGKYTDHYGDKANKESLPNASRGRVRRAIVQATTNAAKNGQTTEQALKAGFDAGNAQAEKEAKRLGWVPIDGADEDEEGYYRYAVGGVIPTPKKSKGTAAA